MDRVRRCAIAVAAVAALAAGEPSPADAPGLRILPAPVITHWPAIALAGERRHVAFSIAYHDPGLHRRQPGLAPGTLRAGDEVEVGWEGDPVAVRLPAGREGVGGLLPLPGPGSHRATLAGHPGSLRVVPAGDPWPIAGLRDAFPVDASGAAVVLLDRRVDRAGDRAFRWLGGTAPRPAGPPLILGPGAAVTGLPGRPVPCDHPTHPHHAALVALSGLGRGDDPRTVIWMPGPEAIASGAWREEDRLLGAVRTRCAALGILPRLVLVLPEMPDRPEPDHLARRQLLRAAARGQEWEVVEPGPVPPGSPAPGVETAGADRSALRRRLAVLAE